MMNLELAKQALNIFQNCHIIFVGDSNQLPCIGVGNFLKDIVESPYIPTVELIKTVRNSGNIKKNAHTVNAGNHFYNFTYGSDFVYQKSVKENLMTSIMTEYCKYRQSYKEDEVIVLCCQKSRGIGSVNECNQAIQKMVNPNGMLIPNTYLHINDRVMYTKNSYNVDGIKNGEKISAIFNGDCGKIVQYDKQNEMITFQCDDGRIYKIELENANNFILAYAMTVHKSQGSEYPVVILPFTMQHFMMLKRNILYTAITRAKKHLSLLGEGKAISIAISDNSYNQRKSTLQLRISQYFN